MSPASPSKAGDERSLLAMAEIGAERLPNKFTIRMNVGLDDGLAGFPLVGVYLFLASDLRSLNGDLAYQVVAAVKGTERERQLRAECVIGELNCQGNRTFVNFSIALGIIIQNIKKLTLTTL